MGETVTVRSPNSQAVLLFCLLITVYTNVNKQSLCTTCPFRIFCSQLCCGFERVYVYSCARFLFKLFRGNFLSVGYYLFWLLQAKGNANLLIFFSCTPIQVKPMPEHHATLHSPCFPAEGKVRFSIFSADQKLAYTLTLELEK